jgi:hypothetical protein
MSFIKNHIYYVAWSFYGSIPPLIWVIAGAFGDNVGGPYGVIDRIHGLFPASVLLLAAASNDGPWSMAVMTVALIANMAIYLFIGALIRFVALLFCSLFR